MKYPLLIAFLLAGGCAGNDQGKTPTSPALQPKSVPATQITQKQSDAWQTLIDVGLAQDSDYEDVSFIANSNRTMIVATVKNAPCKMVFKHVSTHNEDFWMPQQISCKNHNDMTDFISADELSGYSLPRAPVVDSL
ncbi:hypothetical protein [Photorhabdus asymbiotica]|uniref:hypothetical protein n=1 Tax=Photorhabdus asymbiotica TaxID=291112 RepID=UPI003DA76989